MTGDDPEAQQQGPILAECPCCGEDTAWYRLDPLTAAAAVAAVVPEQDRVWGEKAYGGIALDSLPSSLCEECFQDAVPPSQRERWKRIELAEDARSASSEAQQEQRWANQATAVRNWANNQNAGSSSGWG